MSAHGVERVSPRVGARRGGGACGRGATLVELIVVVAVSLVVLAIVYGALALSERWVASEAVGIDLVASAHAALDGIQRELRSSGPSRVAVPSAGGRSARLVFQPRLTLFDATGVDEADWQPVVTYRLEPSGRERPSNGLDDDGDGVIDEQRLVREQDGEVRTVVDGVVGLEFARPALEPLVEITITLASHDASDAARSVRTQTRSVAVMLRNGP